MSFTLAASPLLAPFTATDNAANLFSAEADLAAMLRFELALAVVQEKVGSVSKGTAARVDRASKTIDLNPASFAHAIAQDGMVVPELVRRLKAAVPKASRDHVHQHSTSQDVIDTSLMLRTKEAIAGIRVDLRNVEKLLAVLNRKFGRRTLMARTRMQRALPITVSDRLSNWKTNCVAAESGLAALLFPLQLSGPVGTFNPHYKSAMAKALGLTSLEHSWHVERSPILAIGNACAAVAGAGAKIGVDIALMAQNELAEIKMTGGGSSSAMHHKQNPVKAELLLTLARFSAAQLSALHTAGIHEQERSGTAWTLEWLVLPQLICSAAASARMARELLESIESIG